MMRALSVAATALLLAACGTPPPIVPDEAAKGGSPLNEQDPAKYPVGPYGFVSGGVIPDLEFVGVRDDDNSGIVTDDKPTKIRLSDYFQDKKVKVIAILIAAEWCNPCQQEQWELVDSWKKYQQEAPGEVVYVEALVESARRDANNRFLPADLDTLERWGGRSWPPRQGVVGTPQMIPFALVADPTMELGPWYLAPAYPTQIVVKADDMTIQWQNAGYGPGALEGNIDGVLGR